MSESEKQPSTESHHEEAIEVADLNRKKWIIAIMGMLFIASLVVVQFIELQTKKNEASGERDMSLTTESEACYTCHAEQTPGIIGHWKDSKHAELGVGCYECHKADENDLDAWKHNGYTIATIVTPKDCGGCHSYESEEFQASHHAKAGNILHSLDNTLAEEIEGHRGKWQIDDPHNPGTKIEISGDSFAKSGCQQCHGTQVALLDEDGNSVTPWSLTIDAAKGGLATVNFDASALEDAKIQRNDEGKPKFDSSTWPNTGVGRLNLDGSRGSCSACHSRHDFSPRRARQPENCGKCHLGPDHPQKEIYDESKHGVAYRDMKDKMGLEKDKWVVGEDYSAAPTCATCHMSATKTQKISHNPAMRISWNNRPPVSKKINREERMSDGSHKVVTSEERRDNMKNVCQTCHAPDYVSGFYEQYDNFVNLYNAMYGTPGSEIMKLAHSEGLLTKANFDEEVEWTWFLVWHHEGRRARHGASMMAPDYSHWHGTFEVAHRWYQEFVPQLNEIIEHGKQDPKTKAGAEKLEAKLLEVLSRPEHQKGAAAHLRRMKAEKKHD